MIENPEQAQDVALRAAAWARAQLRGDREALAAIRPETLEDAEDLLMAMTAYMLLLAGNREQMIDELVQAQLKRDDSPPVDWDAVKARTLAHPRYSQCICAPGVECGWDDAEWHVLGSCPVCSELMYPTTDDDAFLCPADIDPEKFKNNKTAYEEWESDKGAYEQWHEETAAQHREWFRRHFPEQDGESEPPSWKSPGF